MTPIPFSTGESGSSYTSTYTYTYIPMLPLLLSGGGCFLATHPPLPRLGPLWASVGRFKLGGDNAEDREGSPSPPSCPLVCLYCRSSFKTSFAAQPILFLSSSTITGDRGRCLSRHRTSAFFVRQRAVAARSHPYLIVRM